MTTISNSVQAGEQLHCSKHVETRSLLGNQMTYVEAGITDTCGIHIRQDRFKVGDRRKVGKEAGMLPVSDTRQDLCLEIARDDGEVFSLLGSLIYRAKSEIIPFPRTAHFGAYLEVASPGTLAPRSS